MGGWIIIGLAIVGGIIAIADWQRKHGKRGSGHYTYDRDNRVDTDLDPEPGVNREIDESLRERGERARQAGIDAEAKQNQAEEMERRRQEREQRLDREWRKRENMGPDDIEPRR